MVVAKIGCCGDNFFRISSNATTQQSLFSEIGAVLLNVRAVDTDQAL